jgi:hypothetical protein
MKLPNLVLDRFPNWPSLLHRFLHVFARDFRTGSSTDSRTGLLPKFAPPPAWGSGPPHVRDPITPPNQDSRTSHIREFGASQVPGFRKSWVSRPWKTCLKNFVKLNVTRVTGLPEFSNTSPSGKLLDSDDPIPRNLRKFSKKRHPRNVGGDTRRSGTLEWLIEAGFAELPLPAPINSGLSLLKILRPSRSLAIRGSFLLAEF